jgi:hypothetical protein
MTLLAEMTHFADICPGRSSIGPPRFLKCAFCIVLFALPVLGQSVASSNEVASFQPRALSVDEIALELENPATLLRSVAWDLKYTTFQGTLPEANDQTAISNVFTPSWPIRLSNGKHLLLSATITINGDHPGWKPVGWIDYPQWLIRQLPDFDETVGGFSSGHGHMDNLAFDIGYGGVNDDGVIRMFSIANVAPTSDDRSAMRRQWLLGPELALGRTTSWGLYGIRAKHLTDIWSGSNPQDVEFDTNETTLKLFFAYSLGNGWLLEANPVILYDWEAVSGNEWTVPVGAGLSKTFMLGKVPVKLGLEIQNHIVSPDRFGPEWLVNLNLTPIISTRLLR